MTNFLYQDNLPSDLYLGESIAIDTKKYVLENTMIGYAQHKSQIAITCLLSTNYQK